jgi:hypothetical protein
MTTEQEQAVKQWTLRDSPDFPVIDRFETGNFIGVKTCVGGHQHGILSKNETFSALEGRLTAKFRPEVLA